MSPVIEAYLKGFEQQQGIIHQGNQLNQQKLKAEADKADRDIRVKELEDIAKRFDVTSKQHDERIALDRAAQDAVAKLHMHEAKQDIMKQFETGLRAIQGQTIQDPNVQNMSKPLFQPNPTQSVDVMGVPTQFSTAELDTPDKVRERAAETARLLSGIKLDEFTKEEKVRQSGRESLLESKLDMAGYMKEIALANAKEIAELRGGQKMRDQFLNMGFANPEDMKKSAALAAHDIELGRADINDFKDKAYINTITQALQTGGVNKFPQGVKGRNALDQAWTQGAKLLNTFDQLNATHPPAKTTMGGLGDKLAAMTSITDIGKDYALYQSDLVNFARANGVTSVRMMDSDKEKEIQKAALISPMDNAKVRQDKRFKVVDGIFTAVQGQLSALPKEQRSIVWRDLILGTPGFADDHTLREVMEKTIESGTYSSTYINRGNR